MANRQTVESLIPRVEGLAESLRTPVPEGEIKERDRRDVLKRYLAGYYDEDPGLTLGNL